jgi:hypothetical protein
MSFTEPKRLDLRPCAHWPNAWVDSRNPDTVALAGLLKSWLDFHRAGATKQAEDVLESIGRRPVDPVSLFVLWRQAELALEHELAARILELIEYRAAAESGKANPGPRIHRPSLLDGGRR